MFLLFYQPESKSENTKVTAIYDETNIDSVSRMMQVSIRIT